MANQQQTNFWLYTKFLVSAVTIILSILYIVDLVTKPQSELVATVEYGNMIFPPGINKAFEKIRNLEEVKNIEEGVSLKYIQKEYFKKLSPIVEENLSNLSQAKGVGEKQAKIMNEIAADINNSDINVRDGLDQLIYSFSEYIHDNVPYELPRPFRVLNGYWQVVLSNNGNKRATGVTLKLPYTQLVSIKKEGHDAIILVANEIIELNEVKPKEEIQIFAWTTNTPHRFNLDELRLTHDGGLGEVDIYVPLSPFWQQMEKWSVFVLFGFGIPTLLFIMLLINWNRASKNDKALLGETEKNEEDTIIGSD